MIPSQLKTETIKFLNQNKLLLLIPIVCSGLLGLAYGLTAARPYEATQTLILRDDLLGDSFKPGQFQSEESLKNAQETLLHVATKPSVVAAALIRLFPDDFTAENPPSQKVLDSTRDNISVMAPNGAEFGKTNVVLLRVKNNTSAQALALTQVLTHEIEQNLGVMHDSLLASMQQELEQQYIQASKIYAATADKIRKIEVAVGADLESLRSLVEPNSSSSQLQRTFEQLQTEKRSFQNEIDLVEKQLEGLAQAKLQGETSLATNSQLLQMQPVLERLYNGLVDAQLKLAVDSSKYLSKHPAITNAKKTVEITRQKIQEEIGTIEAGLRMQWEIAQQKLNRVDELERQYYERSSRVNGHRVEYQTLVNELTKQGEARARLQASLAEVGVAGPSETRVSLITKMGSPEVKQAKTTSRAMVLLASLFLGGMVGLGLVFLWGGPLPDLQGMQWERPKVSSKKEKMKRAGKTSVADAEPPKFGARSQKYGGRPVDILKGLSASEVDADSSTQEPITRSASDSHVADLGPNSDTVVRDKEAMLVGASAMKSFAEQNADPSEELTVIEFENASPDDLTGFAPSAVALDAVAPGGEQPTSEEQWPTDLSESPSLRGTSSETAEISSQTQVGVQNTETTAVVESVETTTVDEDRPTPKNASDRLAERLRNLASASGQSAPARPRSEPTTRPAEEFKTIEIESLKSQLNAAGLGRAAPDSNIEVLEPQTEVGSTSENQKRLTERLSKLSESIAAYCEPVKKESPQ